MDNAFDLRLFKAKNHIDEDQLALLTPLTVEPVIPYRVWA
jgi:hypothetical protein